MILLVTLKDYHDKIKRVYLILEKKGDFVMDNHKKRSTFSGKLDMYCQQQGLL